MIDANIKKQDNKSRLLVSTGINMVAFILSVTAGWINIAGIELFLKNDSAFMTGRFKALGYHILNLDLKSFFGVLLVVIAFIIGSFISTIVTRRTGLKGGLICTGIFIMVSSLPISTGYINVIFLPMAMGCQNAATSLTPVNRTTHLTGPITDLGIELAKGNWNKVTIWTWRLIGLPLGSFIGLYFVRMVKNNVMSISLVLIIPAVIIILTGIIQEKIFNIPLLD